MTEKIKNILTIITIILLVLASAFIGSYFLLKNRNSQTGYFVAYSNYDNNVEFDLNGLSTYFGSKNISTRYLGANDLFLFASPNDINGVIFNVEISISQIVKIGNEVKAPPQITCTIINENGYQIFGTEEELSNQITPLQTTINIVTGWVNDYSGISPIKTEVYFSYQTFL
jgi:hypothetical protein